MVPLLKWFFQEKMHNFIINVRFFYYISNMITLKNISTIKLITVLVVILTLGLSSCSKTELNDMDADNSTHVFDKNAADKGIGDNGGDDDQDKEDAKDAIGDNGGDDDQDKEDKPAKPLSGKTTLLF